MYLRTNVYPNTLMYQGFYIFFSKNKSINSGVCVRYFYIFLHKKVLQKSFIIEKALSRDVQYFVRSSSRLFTLLVNAKFIEANAEVNDVIMFVNWNLKLTV